MTIISETALLRSLVRLNISDTAAQNHLFNQIGMVENQIRQLETANDIHSRALLASVKKTHRFRKAK